MLVSTRQLSILAIVAAGMVVLTAVLYTVETSGGAGAQQGSLLIQGLELANVATITITKKDDSTTLDRSQDAFVVADRSNYPASLKKVNELLQKCLEIHIAETVTTNADNYADLGVLDDPKAAVGQAKKAIEQAEKDLEKAPDDAARKQAEKAKKDAEKQRDDAQDTLVIVLADKDGKALVDLRIGKSAAHGSGKYVRLKGQETVYASEESIWLQADPKSYMATDIIPYDDLKKDDIKQVDVTVKGKAYTVHRDKDDKIVLKSVPEGKKQKDSDVESVFSALTSLSFSDVAADWPQGATPDATFNCETKKQVVYTVQLAKHDDKHHIKIAAQGPPRDALQKRAEEIAKELNKDDRDNPIKLEELKKKDDLFKAFEGAIKFNGTHGKWVYEVSSWKADNMRKPLDDLIEDKPKPDEPDEIAASHILISYKGADKADAKITRSKADAKTRADEALKKAKDKDADFAALAKEYSDGPSKDKGGDLGTFKKGKMHKNFEDAAWKLEVDEISPVVETPFGFHVIKRTK